MLSVNTVLYFSSIFACVPCMVKCDKARSKFCRLLEIRAEKHAVFFYEKHPSLLYNFAQKMECIGDF
jgi:hypothetical protein